MSDRYAYNPSVCDNDACPIDCEHCGKKDSTEEITKKVKEILVKQGYLYKRLVSAFNFQASEKLINDIKNAKSFIHIQYYIIRNDELWQEIEDVLKRKEKLEQEIKKLFPEARVIRMDADTTTNKGAHEDIINRFKNHEYDILLGTQMISKGLNFPLVTLVGVINADATLNIPDFRSGERTFALLSQVSGRAGRSDLAGEVVIQTYNPDHYSIRYAKNHDYLNFYKEEMNIRRELCYSPYFYITLVNISSKDYELGFREANKIGEYLRKNLSNGTRVLGPSMANIFRINNVYHYQCIIKYKKDEKLNKVLREIDNIYKVNNRVDVDVDVDPVRI